MKDALGHGSNPRGGAFNDAAHREARRRIQLHPNDPNEDAENVLRTFGYGPNDIARLRANAGAAVKDVAAAHQYQVAALPRNFSASTDLLKGAAGLGPFAKDLTNLPRKKFGSQ